MDLTTCKSRLEVQLCMNYLITRGFGTPVFREEEITGHQKMKKAIAGKKVDEEREYLITMDDNEYSERPIEADEAILVLKGIQYAARSAFMVKAVHDYEHACTIGGKKC